MDESKLQYFRDRLQQPPEPPLEATRKFLMSYCADKDSMEDIEGHVALMTTINTRTLEAGLAGMEGVLANPPPEGTLAQIIAWEVGWVLADESEESARAWLRELADMVRKHLGKSA